MSKFIRKSAMAILMIPLVIAFPVLVLLGIALAGDWLWIYRQFWMETER